MTTAQQQQKKKAFWPVVPLHTLLKENDVVTVDTKVVVLLEIGNGGGASGSGGHDIPGDDDVVNSTGLLLGHLLKLEDTLGLDLEQRLVGRQRDIVATLGSGGAETRSLTTGQENDGDLVLADLVQSNGAPLLSLFSRGVHDRVKALLGQRGEKGGLVAEHGRGAGGGLLVDPVDALDVQGSELVEELFLFLSDKVIVVGEEVSLSGSLVALLEVAHGLGGR